jgi:hypothetical protein
MASEKELQMEKEISALKRRICELESRLTSGDASSVPSHSADVGSLPQSLLPPLHGLTPEEFPRYGRQVRTFCLLIDSFGISHSLW